MTASASRDLTDRTCARPAHVAREPHAKSPACAGQGGPRTCCAALRRAAPHRGVCAAVGGVVLLQRLPAAAATVPFGRGRPSMADAMCAPRLRPPNANPGLSLRRNECYCTAIAVLLQCCCNAAAVLLQCYCSDIAVLSQRYGSAMAVCYCSAIAVLLQCYCSAIAVLLHCHRCAIAATEMPLQSPCGAHAPAVAARPPTAGAPARREPGRRPAP